MTPFVGYKSNSESCRLGACFLVLSDTRIMSVLISTSRMQQKIEHVYFTHCRWCRNRLGPAHLSMTSSCHTCRPYRPLPTRPPTHPSPSHSHPVKNGMKNLHAKVSLLSPTVIYAISRTHIWSRVKNGTKSLHAKPSKDVSSLVVPCTYGHASTDTTIILLKQGIWRNVSVKR